MDVQLEWLGVSTFRLTLGSLVVFLDAYVDRVPSAPPVGITSAEVERADYILVGHSHFDHLFGAATIAAKTGATIVGSYESMRLMSDAGVDERQLMAVSAGSRCSWPPTSGSRFSPASIPASGRAPAVSVDEECLGDLGVSHQERLGRLSARGGLSGWRRGNQGAPGGHRAAHRGVTAGRSPM